MMFLTAATMFLAASAGAGATSTAAAPIILEGAVQQVDVEAEESGTMMEVPQRTSEALFTRQISVKINATTFWSIARGINLGDLTQKAVWRGNAEVGFVEAKKTASATLEIVNGIPGARTQVISSKGNIVYANLPVRDNRAGSK
eukprot:CAMPEP_0181111764 /NCGR_PEP_ID=MMETSP1071-20121207/19450_1 /TAXON_ID=35127 /ORGANISM="Thalassiosira sp., Strain NH16" /LENGTH=143 /DNA_ID=CAMNT_0023195681 /DNA_START=69 /DNA_END=501 /DNA_ORIENTATION=+